MDTGSLQEINRQAVLDLVYQAIREGVPSHLVAEYMKAARKYGQLYGISHLVEDWLQQGRTVFSSTESAQEWADTLPTICHK